MNAEIEKWKARIAAFDALIKGHWDQVDADLHHGARRVAADLSDLIHVRDHAAAALAKLETENNG